MTTGPTASTGLVNSVLTTVPVGQPLMILIRFQVSCWSWALAMEVPGILPTVAQPAMKISNSHIGRRLDVFIMTIFSLALLDVVA
jgi:hypothetical protein